MFLVVEAALSPTPWPRKLYALFGVLKLDRPRPSNRCDILGTTLMSASDVQMGVSGILVHRSNLSV